MSHLFDFIESYKESGLNIQTKPSIGLVMFEDKINGKFCLMIDVDDTKKTMSIRAHNPKDPNDSQLAGLINNKNKFTKLSKIVDLMDFIKEVLPIITNFCVGCYKKMEFQSGSYVTCGTYECDYKFEELYIGNPVTEMAKNDPDLVHFLFDSAKDAITCERKFDIFEPFPTYFLKDRTVVTTKRGDLSALKMTDYNNLKDFDRLTSVINRIKINKFIEAADIAYDDAELIKDVGDDIYSLMRFIVLSCKVQLKPDKLLRDTNKETVQLDAQGKIIEKGALLCKAYKVIHSQEKNDEFLKLKGESGMSHFLFHGSRWHNWYSILRNGLKNCSKTKLMTAGAAYGDGIYLSDDANLSLGYGMSGKKSIIGVFEIIGDKSRYKKGSAVYVCPDETQLIQRYLLIIPTSSGSSATADLNNIFNNEIYSDNSKTKSRLLTKGIKKLVKEYKKISKLDKEKAGFRVEVDPTNSYLWKVYIFGYDPKSMIGKDMDALGIKEIEMEVRFPDNYPLSPPFIRVVTPRFKYQTGHVTSAGALCMQVLTDKFWSPACSIESLIVTIKSEILEGEGRLDYEKYKIPYTLNEARTSFINVARGHNWV
jgi:ubiquitin-conjugating enzyme E2 Q